MTTQLQERANTTQDLKAALAHCTGSEHWYRHALVRPFLYTDGVKLFADMAGAYWFLDIIATEVFRYQAREEFIHIKMDVKGGAAVITADDGNGAVFWSRNIDFTDCPEGEWRFYLANSTMLLPSEY